MKNAKTVTYILVALALVGGAFFGGMEYEKSKKPNGFGNGVIPGGGQLSSNGRGTPGGQNNNMLSGEISSIDDKTITIKIQDGSMKIVYLKSDSSITKSVVSSSSDLSQGSEVVVSGTSNSDGSLTASTVQIRQK